MALKDLLARTTLLDRIIVLALFAGTLAGAVRAGSAPAGERLVVERDGKILFAAPLGEERTFALKGTLGETVVALQGGKARILASPCPHKVCLGMGPIGRDGEIVACVPNGIVLRVEGGKPPEKDYDLLSR